MLWYYAQHSSRVDSSRWLSRFPASPAVIRFSRIVWSRVHNTFCKQNLAFDQTFKPLYRAWSQLGRALTAAEKNISSAGSTSPDASSSPTERCASEECACSVFRTSHAMKVCRGCWGVSYCNAICQKRYVSSDVYRHVLTFIAKRLEPSSETLQSRAL